MRKKTTDHFLSIIPQIKLDKKNPRDQYLLSIILNNNKTS